jgi:hypothetical protein
VRRLALSCFGPRALVRCPIGSAFDFVGHDFFQNYTGWCPQVIELEPLSDGPVRPGVTARQITLDRGIRSESTFEITTFGPPKLLCLKGLSETFKSSYEFEEQTATSTQVVFSFELEERELFMRPFKNLIRRGSAADDRNPQTVAREPARERL